MGKSGEKDPIATVRRAEGGSRKAVPFRVIPALGQASEYLAKELAAVESKEVCDVLHEHVSRSKVANNSEHLPPKSGLGVPEAGARTGAADALAREAAGDDMRASCVGSDVSDIGIDGYAWEATPEDALAELVLLTEPDVLEPGEVESVGEEPAAVEESTNGHDLALGQPSAWTPVRR